MRRRYQRRGAVHPRGKVRAQREARVGCAGGVQLGRATGCARRDGRAGPGGGEVVDPGQRHARRGKWTTPAPARARTEGYQLRRLCMREDALLAVVDGGARQREPPAVHLGERDVAGRWQAEVASSSKRPLALVRHKHGGSERASARADGERVGSARVLTVSALATSARCEGCHAGEWHAASRRREVAGSKRAGGEQHQGGTGRDWQGTRCEKRDEARLAGDVAPACRKWHALRWWRAGP